MSSKSKSTTTKSKPRAKKINGKKICPEGYNCPYKSEYQHQLEFTHDDTDNNNNNNDKTSSTSSTKVFSGKGRTLNEDNNKKRKHDNNNNDDDKFPGRPYSLTQRPLQGAEKTTIKKETNNDNNNKKAKGKVNDKKVNDNDDKIPCDICQAMVPFSSYGEHILTH